MGDYAGDLLVWAIILAIVAILVKAFIKRKQVFIVAVGVLLIIGALPAGFLTEISANGVAGAPSKGYEWVGFVVGIALLVAGIVIIVLSKKLSKHNT